MAAFYIHWQFKLILCCYYTKVIYFKKVTYIEDLTSAHVLLNLLNELGKRDKMRGLPSILSLFRNEHEC